jgi:hypothetical protein
VDFGLDLTNILNSELPVRLKANSISVSGKFDGVKPVLSLESRISRFLPLPYPAKESRKSPVKPTHCSLSAGEVDFLEPLISAPLVGKPGGLVVVRERDFVLFIGEFAAFKTGVIEFAVSFEHDAQFAYLIGVRIKTKFVCAPHTRRIPHFGEKATKNQKGGGASSVS